MIGRKLFEVGAVLAILVLFFTAPLAGAELKIHAINVTKGDATFIEFPDGTTWLIDLGNSGDSGERVHDYIVALGYSSIDYVVATHFDMDHYGGIDEVLSQGVPPLFYTTAAYEHVGPKVTGDDSYTLTWDDETTSPLRSSPSPGQTWTFGGVTVECVCVGDTDTGRSNLLDDSYVSLNGDENHYSLGFRISWGGFDYVTLGDLGSNVEDVLAPKISDSSFDVLHASHHGSSTATSLSFCETLQPEVALISVGSSNSYGHPTQEVLDNLNGTGSSWGGVERIYVTEEGQGGTGSASNMYYLSDDIVVTYDILTNQYSVVGGSRNDTYDADELSGTFPIRINFQPAERLACAGFLIDSGEAYGTQAGYGWDIEAPPSPTPEPSPTPTQVAFTGFESIPESDPIGYTLSGSVPDDQEDAWGRWAANPRTGTYSFTAQDCTSGGTCTFDGIDVAGLTDVEVHLWLAASGDFEAGDYARAYVRVDGQDQGYFMNMTGDALDSLSYTEYTYNVPAGACSIVIVYEVLDSSNTEIINIDDVEVRGTAS